MPYATANLLPDTAANVHREVSDVLVRHAQLNGDHENVVAGQVCSFKGADFVDDAALKQSDDPAAVVEIAGETVELPGQYGVGLAPLDATQDIVEHLSAGFFGALTFAESPNNEESLASSDGIQLRDLSVDGENLSILVLGGFAAVDEIFGGHIHGFSVAHIHERSSI